MEASPERYNASDAAIDSARIQLRLIDVEIEYSRRVMMSANDDLAPNFARRFQNPDHIAAFELGEERIEDFSVQQKTEYQDHQPHSAQQSRKNGHDGKRCSRNGIHYDENFDEPKECTWVDGKLFDHRPVTDSPRLFQGSLPQRGRKPASLPIAARKHRLF